MPREHDGRRGNEADGGEDLDRLGLGPEGELDESREKAVASLATARIGGDVLDPTAQQGQPKAARRELGPAKMQGKGLVHGRSARSGW